MDIYLNKIKSKKRKKQNIELYFLKKNTIKGKIKKKKIKVIQKYSFKKKKMLKKNKKILKNKIVIEKKIQIKYKKN